MKFVALDFETANRSAGSACALALVAYEDGIKTGELSLLLRPPDDDFEFTYIHNLTWDMVKNSPTFGEAWNDISTFVGNPDYFAAHNAPFDRGVFHACCAAAGLPKPDITWIDTVQVARKVWDIFPTKLNLVCEKKGIVLDHHEALSDASACGEILRMAWEDGWRPEGVLGD